MERKRQRWKVRRTTTLLLKEQRKGQRRSQLPELQCYYTRPKGSHNNYRKSKGKGKGDKSQGPPLPSNPYKYNKGKGGKQTDTVCYDCGKPGHTSDK
eukprot:4222541-Amphidinium_carterae.1